MRQRGQPATNQSKKNPSTSSTKKPRIHKRNRCSVFNLVFPTILFMALGFAVMLRQGALPTLASDIEADGGRWVEMYHNGALRKIEYFVCGAENGAIVYAQHGYGSSGKFWVMDQYCQVAKKMNLKIVSPSMPGFGLSDSYPLDEIRLLIDWPADVITVLEHAGLKGNDSFYVTCVGEGCVHVAAVSHKYLDRISGVGLISPSAPHHEFPNTGAQSSKLLTRIIKHALLQPYLGDTIAFLLGHLMDSETRYMFIRNVIMGLQRMEQQGGSLKKYRDDFVEDSDRASKHTYRGWTDNMHVVLAPLKFQISDLSKIAASDRNVIITYAPDDRVNPPEIQKWYKKQIQGSQLIESATGYGFCFVLLPETAEMTWSAMIH